MIMKTSIVSSSGLLISNLRELLEKKSKQSPDTDAILSVMVGMNIEEGILIRLATSGSSLIVINSVKLQGLTVKMHNIGKQITSTS